MFPQDILLILNPPSLCLALGFSFAPSCSRFFFRNCRFPLCLPVSSAHLRIPRDCISCLPCINYLPILVSTIYLVCYQWRCDRSKKKEARIKGLGRNERMCLHVRQILPPRLFTVTSVTKMKFNLKIIKLIRLSKFY